MTGPHFLIFHEVGGANLKCIRGFNSVVTLLMPLCEDFVLLCSNTRDLCPTLFFSGLLVFITFIFILEINCALKFKPWNHYVF